MIIRGARIERFGRFTDVAFSGLPDGLTVVVGPNEAGKSTLHAFIRGVLFGFPTGKSNERKLTFQGLKAGDLELEVDGKQLWVERQNAPKQPVIVKGMDGSVGNEQLLGRLLGGADARLFQSVFAFSLKELQDLEALNADQVRDRMFSAAIGTGQRAPAKVGAEMEDQARLLYVERGGGRKASRLSALFSEIEQIDRDIATARARAGSFGVLEADIEQCANQLRRLRERERALLSEQALCDALMSLAERWALRGALLSQEESLGESAPLSNADELRFADIRTALQRDEEALRELEEQRAEAMAKVEGAEIDEVLVKHHALIHGVAESYQVQRERLQRIGTYRTEVQFAKQALAGQLEKLGAAWTEESLAHWSGSHAKRQECHEWKDRLERASNAVKDAERTLKSAAAESSQCADEEARLRAQMPPAPRNRTEIERDEARLQRIRALREVQRERQQEHRDAEAKVLELQRLSSARVNPSRTLLLGALLALVAAALGAYREMQLLTIIAIVVAGLLLIVALLQARRASDDGVELASVRSVRDESASAVKKASDALGEALAAAGRDTLPSAEELTDALATLRVELDAHTKIEARLEQVRGAEAASQRARERLEAAQGELDKVRSALEREQAAWRRAREAIGAGSAREPVDAMSVIEVLDAARERLDQLSALKKRADEEETTANTWTERAREVLGIAGNHSHDGKGPSEVLDAVVLLAGRSREAYERMQERERNREAAKVIEARWVIAGERVVASRESVADLLASTGCGSEAEFVARAETHRKRVQLVERRVGVEEQVSAVLRALPEQESALSRLSSETQADWQARKVTVEEELAVAKAEIESTIARRTELMTERDRLVKEADVASLSLQRASRTAESRTVIGEWLQLSLASRLIRETRDRYERERQPAVIAGASPLFASVTGGKYVRIAQREGEFGLDVMTSDGKRWRESELSQGTREQLYLCLRLALAAEFSRDRVALPLLMDDVLVNFDPERASAVSRVLADVSRSRQVLLFTCHPESVQLLQSFEPTLRLVELPA